MNNTIKKVLQDQLKINSFRPGQEEIIQAILSGNNVLGIMPTGAGKSLCYQLPALLFDHVTIIISPLIALMKDQVDALQILNLPATFINSALSRDETYQRIQDIRRGLYKIVYIAPERFYAASFMKLLSQITISFLAVDEAHCISQWGHDFRPSYLKLKEIIKMIGAPPVAAFTATATSEVQQDILVQLDIPEAKVFIKGFDRPNLKYFAVNLSNDEKEAEMLRIIPTIKNSGIVYVSTQRAAESVTAVLNSHGISAAFYHGGMDKAQRHEVQEKWLGDNISVIVATNAFGMGIDKFNVRFVMHYNMPGSLEAYYQEAGRAGRDGKTSYCLLFFNYSDRKLQEFFIENNYPPVYVLEDIYKFLFSLNRQDIYLTYREIGQACGTNDMAIAAAIKLFEQYNILQRMNQQSLTIQADFIIPAEKALSKVQRADNQKLLVEQLLPHNGHTVTLKSVLQETGLSQEQFSAAIREVQNKGILIYTPPFRGRGISLTSQKVPWKQIGIDFDVYNKRKERQLQKIDIVEQYIESRVCRREYILNYFGDKYHHKNCNGCDICLNWKPEQKSQPRQAETTGKKKTILLCIEEFNQRFGVTTIANLLRGDDYERFSKSGITDNKFFAALETMSLNKIRGLIFMMIKDGQILKSQGEYPVLSINKNWSQPQSPSPVPSYRKTARESAGQNANMELFERLKKLRKKLAGNLPPFHVCGDQVLYEVSAYMPENLDELINIRGFGNKRVRQYGEQFLKVINRFVIENPTAKSDTTAIVVKKRYISPGVKTGTLSSTIRQTYNYFQGGMSVRQIAEMRVLKEARIIYHLIQAIEHGQAVDISREVSLQNQQVILDKAKELGVEKYKPIKEALPDNYSYEDIKLTLAGAKA